MKRISKAEAAKVINNADALEIILEEIDRNDTSSNKQSLLRRFSAEIQKQIKDDRNILLIAVKIR